MTIPWHEKLIVRLFLPVAGVVLVCVCVSLAWVCYEATDRLLAEGLLKAILAIGAATILVLAFLVYLVIQLFVQRPVDGLLEGVRKLRGGDLDSRIELASGGEFAEVGEVLNDLAAGISGQMARSREQNYELSVLYAVVGRLSTTINLLELKGVILDLLVEVFEGVECAAFAFRPSAEGVIEVVRRSAPFDKLDESVVLEMRGGNITPCAQFPGLELWVRGDYDSPAQVETEWDRLIPLEARGKRIGALFVRKARTSYFSSREEKLLRALGSHVSVALENAKLCAMAIRD